MAGPLQGTRIVEMAGIGPGPFAAMMLADMGAEVIRVDRKPRKAGAPLEPLSVDRGRRCIALDLKKPGAADVVLRLVEGSDALIEGFRPGVMERLGLGPDVCLARNPRLVFGRMTGWGQDGPLSQAAGHDINYIAITGVLNAMGRAGQPPSPPLHLVGDLAGGGMMMAFGIACGLFESKRSGKGQVIDAAISDGVATLTGLYHSMLALGGWRNTREDNLLDGGAHFYGCYECADGRFVSIGSIEPQFYALLLEKCGIADPAFQKQNDPAGWPDLRAKLTALFRTKTRDQWCALMEGTDVCFAPVLDWKEAPEYPHHRARGTYTTQDGLLQPAPSPRFSRTPGTIGRLPKSADQDNDALLQQAGFSEADIARLRADQVI
ncbi:MAG TPA: CaiB/BaiF CoA-transferase family protein [Nevskiaceae bacterium]|nr:CaiB/BaiF CoA-transferase family protein [Nevskiaceae bacterium]